MSIPLDRLYYFLHDHCNHDVVIYHFFPHGSKKPENVTSLFVDQDIASRGYYLDIPVLFHDQEPLQFDRWGPIPKPFKIPNHSYSRLKVRVSRFNSHDKPILVHSELNSSEVKKFEDDGAIPVYYWCHALIARDWFRYAEHDLRLQKKNIQKKFLIYSRAWSGSREYRLKFTEMLADADLQSHCVTSFSPYDNEEHYTQHNFANQQFKPNKQDLENYFPPNNAPSWASADYDAADYQQTEIEVVLETLFDDSRLHITEKTLRAIATGQPFILCATAGSLEYLRSYGFKTFDQCWDESYDQIQDPVQRLQAVIQLMQDLKDKDITAAQEIARYNQQHFFSSDFTNKVLQEFQNNFNAAAVEAKKYQSGVYFMRYYDIDPGFRRAIPLDLVNAVNNQCKKYSKAG